MRLSLLRQGQSRLQKALFKVISKMVGQVPGPILVMSYRPSFFGKNFAQLFQMSMRRMKHWSIADVELFAAFVSKQNECRF